MPERQVWTILLSRNVKATMEFYSAAAGWRFEKHSFPDWPTWIARSENGDLMAVFVDTTASDFPDAPELWLPHFTVTDLDERMAEAERHGATIVRPPFDVPGFGRVAALRQPGGGLVAWRSPPKS